MARKTLSELTSEIKYPLKPIDAAVAWKCSVKLARQRLWQAEESGLLERFDEHFYPTEFALLCWRKGGFI